MKKESASSGGIGFCGLLTIAFIVLKLCGVIAWSWWWVVSPLWIPLALVIVGFGIWAAWYALVKVPDERKRIASGMNEWAWKNRKRFNKYHGLKPPDNPAIKSKWQQRMEEMQNQQLKK